MVSLAQKDERRFLLFFFTPSNVKYSLSQALRQDAHDA